MTKKSANKIRVHQNYFHRQVRTIIKGTSYIIILHNFIHLAIQTKKMTDVMKEKLNALVEEYRRISSKQK